MITDDYLLRLASESKAESYMAESHSRSIRIMPFGDLQKGEPGFNKELWQEWKRQALSDPNAYLIGMGDYLDKFRPTIRHAVDSILIKDQEAKHQFDEMIMEDMQKFAEELKPFKHRIIGLHTGHHKIDFSAGGINSDQYLGQLLGCKYLGFLSFINLVIARGNPEKKSKLNKKPIRVSVKIFSTHGCGGSSFSHSDMANLERKIMPFWDADIFLRGHSAKVYAAAGAPLFKLSRGRNGTPPKIRRHVRWIINTGGFMEGYVRNATTYVEEKNLPPAALGWVTIEIRVQDHALEPIVITPTLHAPERFG